MKIFIAFPPLGGENIDISGNRLKLNGSEPSDAAGVIDITGRGAINRLLAANAATLLKAKGHQVFWVDAEAREWSYRSFIRYILDRSPDIIAFPAVTAAIKSHWRVINDLQAAGRRLKTVLMGGHVTAFPRESMVRSRVDFILTGGDFDFLLVNLCSRLTNDWQLVRPEKLEPGVWFRRGGKIDNNGPFQLNHNLNRLPFIDRELTDWRLYSGINPFCGVSFMRRRRLEGRRRAYTLAARSCGWKHNSLSDQALLYPGNKPHLRSSASLLNEIGLLIGRRQVEEVFDVSPYFPYGSWLRGFCEGMIKRGYHQQVKLGCRVYLGALTGDDWRLMRRAGFQYIFFNEEHVMEEISTQAGAGSRASGPLMAVFQGQAAAKKLFNDVRAAKRAGLQTYVLVNLGYPWETAAEARQKVNRVRQLLINGWLDGVGVRPVTPLPGSKFYQICVEQGWLASNDWNLYDHRCLVLKNLVGDEQLRRLIYNFNNTGAGGFLYRGKVLNWLKSRRFQLERWRSEIKRLLAFSDESETADGEGEFKRRRAGSRLFD